MFSYHTTLATADCYGHGFKTCRLDTFENLSQLLTKVVWSPIVFKDGRRLRTHFMGARLLVLDFDSGEMTIARAQDIWCDCRHIIGTTRHHQKVKDGKPACDRFRVVMEFSDIVTSIGDYEATMRHFIDEYGADPACKDGARYFFPCVDIVSVSDDGYKQDIIIAPDPIPGSYKKVLNAKSTQYKLTKKFPKWVTKYLKDGAPAGHRHRQALGVAVELFEVGFTSDLVHEALSNVPMSRPWGPGEIERIITHAKARIHSKEEDIG
jgi:hypothetical protein